MQVSDVRPRPLRLVTDGAYGPSVAGREELEELDRLLTKLAGEADPIRAAVLRAWSRTVRSWLRMLR